MKYTLWLCLVALLPMSAHADFAKYGISTGNILTDVGRLDNTWNEEYQAMVLAGEVTADFQGSGTRLDPYQINDVWDLCRLEDKVNNGGLTYKGEYFVMNNDIDLADHIWYPIGVKASTYFEGRFNGNDKTVKNMAIVLVSADDETIYSYGLFGHMRGFIRHLNMKNGYVLINRKGANLASRLTAGLLCGTLGHDMQGNIFGAVYGCHIQGSIGGSVENNFNQTYVGGVAGVAYNPVSIYKCLADVSITTQDIRYVGGIIGWLDALYEAPENRVNSIDQPFASYLSDCVANVSINAELRLSDILYCGGICGLSGGALLACVSNGTITCGLDEQNPAYEMDAVTMTVGGIVGRNSYHIESCVSSATLRGGKIVGGLIGQNLNPSGMLIDNVLNSVFCGHIDSPEADHTHGLVGNHRETNNAPFNCLFVGTMHGGKNKAPLSDGNTNHCYSDRNMFDDGSEWSCYKYTDEFGSANAMWFVNEYQCNVGWESLKTRSACSRTIDLAFYHWNIKSGFYPYYEVNQYNIANRALDDDDNCLVDYVIAVATDCFNDVASTVRTPSLYPKYAWLASVPINVPDHNFRADFVDTPISLAIKQQPIDNEGHQKTATLSVPDNMMDVSGETNAQTATPKDNVGGDMMLTITSDDNVSRPVCLYVYTRHKWDGVIGKRYDSGDGTLQTPYLIHNARQLMKALTDNASGQYYRLTKDIWFNEGLVSNLAEPTDGSIQWNHESRRDSLHWKAHLDGDGHLIRGLYSNNAFGLVETMESGSSIENTGFVDCLVMSPETEEMGEGADDRPLAFLSPSVYKGVKIRNCLFQGVLCERRLLGIPNIGGLLHQAAPQADPYLEDCVVAFATRVKNNAYHPSFALYQTTTGGYVENPNFAERVLVLNNTLATQRLIPIADNTATTNCYYPQGYLKASKYTPDDPDGKTIDEMTDGVFFSGYDKWTVKKGHFPMLTSFANTDYGQLITLPIYTSPGNCFSDMNYLLDFKPGAATWYTSDYDVIQADKDIRVIEPKTAGSIANLCRYINNAKLVTPIVTASDITAGITFTDVEAKKFCLEHYDANGDNAVSLSELKTVTNQQLQDDMNENDGNAHDNDGNLIAQFPEFRYFAGVDNLGSSFQEKENLQQLGFSSHITELPDDAFKGNTSMTSFNVPLSVTTLGAHPFYNSGLEGFEVDSDHEAFSTDNGVLINKDKTELVCWPSAKQGVDVEVPVASPSARGRRSAATTTTVNAITLPANITSLASHSIYKLEKVNGVFLESAAYDYETVKEPKDDAVTPSEGKEIRFFVKDGTHDSEGGSEGEETGEGNGHLLNRYKTSNLWKGKTLDRYWELEVSANSRDNQGRYWATMYLGFDTQLPAGLTAYIVDKEVTQLNSPTLVLRKIGRKVPMLTPVVILAEGSGTFRLFPSKESKYPEIGMSENMLDGVNRNGFNAYQSDANDGSCLTLGRNASGTIGFYIYKGTAKIPPFRAYISVNKVSDANGLSLAFEDETTGVERVNQQQDDGEYYDLKGIREPNPAKGVYVNKGRLVIKK